MNTGIVTVSCPECQQLIDLDADLKIGQSVTCQSCDTDLVVIWLFPVCLDYREMQAQMCICQDGNPK